MVKLLHIDTSPRGDQSNSRQLAKYFMTAWQAKHPETETIYRDLGHHPVPHVTEAWIGGAYTPLADRSSEMQQAIEISDTLIDEFLGVDRLVISVPMYNLNVPSTFKAYIDQIVRVGKTFNIGANGYEGLAGGRKILFVTSSGSDFSTPEMAPYNFQEPYLKAIFGFIGITDITFVNANGVDAGERERVLATAQTELDRLVTSW